MTALGPKLTQTVRNYETNTYKNNVTVPYHVFHRVLCSESEKLARVWLDGSSAIFTAKDTLISDKAH